MPTSNQVGRIVVKKPKKTAKDEAIVLVGTYRPENEKWIAERRLYNLPLPKCGKLDFHERVSGIVLFAVGHPNLAFKAKYREVVDGAWLKKNGYSVSAKPHGETYALYELYEAATPARLLGCRSTSVFVSSSRCPVVKIDEVKKWGKLKGVEICVGVGGLTLGSRRNGRAA